MSYLNELINSENDEVLREELDDRVAIVTHKIKFMEKIPVICLDTLQMHNHVFANEINAAGGILETDILGAVYIIYYQSDKTLNDLMREVPALLDANWQAVKNGRIILLNNDVNQMRTPANAVTWVENFAEMLHPGSFIFGGEGDQWIRFGV